MTLKHRFMAQSAAIFILTAVITACSGYAFAYFYEILHKSPAPVSGGEVIILKDKSIVYQSRDFSAAEAGEMLMNIGMKNYAYETGGVKYRLKHESFSSSGEKYDILRLSPDPGIGSCHKFFALFSLAAFLASFAVLSLIFQRRNERGILRPLSELKKRTEALKEGDLDSAVSCEECGEIGELFAAVEDLRLRLKSSVLSRQKYEENRKFLISSISHDLKTPVTSIRGYIDGVLDNVADTEEKKRDYLKKAAAKTALINAMIDDLLLYSKLDLNQIRFNIEAVELVSYIEDAVEEYSLEFEREQKSILLENSLAAPAWVEIDRDKFRRVVQNIVDNAKKSINSGTGRLTIALRETNSSAIVEFRDNGSGIKKEDLPRIFDRFYRADPARAVGGSSGLGLAIAKEIVEGLGGRIWAIGNDEGGASIIISLKKAWQKPLAKGRAESGEGRSHFNESHTDY